MQLLDTILSESRKYGLYLWIVSQNIQQIRAQLYSAICGERRADILLPSGA